MDILSYNFHDDVIVGGAKLSLGIIRAPYRYVVSRDSLPKSRDFLREQVKVWSALTMCTGQGTVCTVDKVISVVGEYVSRDHHVIQQASPSLMSLAANSRQFMFPD